MIEEQIEKEPGEHLVLVHYGPATMARVSTHQIYEELVYNHADIDRSKVVWARSLGAEKDAELIRHYPNRELWVVEEDGGITLSRGPTQACRRGWQSIHGSSFELRISNVRLDVGMEPTL